MKTLISILILTATLAKATDWCWLSMGPTNVPNVQIYDMSQRGKTGDAADYDKTGCGRPSSYPALVHAPSGRMVINPASVATGKAEILAAIREDIGISNYTNAVSKVAEVTGGKKSLKGAKNSGKNIPTAKQKDYYMATLDALIARIEMLERSMRDHGMLVPEQIGVDEQ